MWNQNVLWSCTYVCIIVLFIETCHSQQLHQFQGQTCSLGNNKNGSCKYLTECESALYKLDKFKIFPIICSFHETIPFVCCEEENEQLINRDNNLNTCNLKNGNPGSCELVSHCEFQTSSIYAEDWNWCGEERRSPICCHKKKPKHIIGETCLLENNKNGTCKLLNECKTAKNKLESFKIKPIICSFRGIEPIVCCEEEKQLLINRDYNPGDTCNLKNGNPGRCELVKDCDFQTSSIYAKDWNWCDQKRISYICCHKKKSKHIIACNRYKALYGIPDRRTNVIYEEEGEGLYTIFGVGGYEVEYGEFPHMALIGFGTENNKVWSCGGTLISEKFVLTAAHCLFLQDLGDARFVRLGELDLKSTNKTIQPQDFNIVEQIIHPDYRPPIVYNDIALLRLERNVSFTDFIHPACLYDKYTVPFLKLNATGWGATEYLGDLNNHLLNVELSAYTFEECYPHYNSQTHKRVLPNGIDKNTHICSGGRGEYKDTCQGDSGGPLQIQSYRDVHYIIGVTSFGKACAIGNSPGVYTRVSAFIPWIENIVWP